MVTSTPTLEPTAGELTFEELQLAARNRGMPLEALRYDVSPAGLHYLLIHFDIPAVDAATWRLKVGGRVRNPLELSLEQVRGENGTAVLVIKCEGSAERRNGNALLGGGCDNVAPTFLAFFYFAAEIIVEHQICQLRVRVKRFLDLPKETRADDAAASPHQSDAAIIQVPFVFFGRGAHEHVPLRIADDLRSIERAFDILDESFF